MINFPFSSCFQRLEHERCVHFISSCELLVARYLFGACFVAQLWFWCSGWSGDEMLRMQGRIQWACEPVVFLSSTCRSPCGSSCEQFFCIPLCCVPSFLSVFLGTLCVSLPHTFVARLSCATLFHARSLHFLKMQGGFRSKLASICI